ncbi:hypothetical protein PCO82_05175 [Pectobacteriaceae bacterium CE90]|nr:hypothetical protein PCO82_05175 [Pectobacteriaceae bacterium CE90]
MPLSPTLAHGCSAQPRIGWYSPIAPIGAPIVGWVANQFGPRWALSIGAASDITAAIVAILALTHRDKISHPDPL